MYFGPQRVAEKTKLYPEAYQVWHGNLWGESIRASSGVVLCAQNHAVLFPGDFVLYTIPSRQGTFSDTLSSIKTHGIGRYRRLIHDENVNINDPLRAVIEPLLHYW